VIHALSTGLIGVLRFTDDVIEGERSIVWQQAENKLYGAASVLEWLLRQK